MSAVAIDNSRLTNALQELLMAEDLKPGDRASYSVCKAIFTTHPLGLKMTAGPVKMAMAKPREISVPDSPEEDVVKAFKDAWRALDVDTHIKNAMTLSRAYGVSSIVIVLDGDDPAQPIDFQRLGGRDISFNVLDPLNTSGSMTWNQNPNQPGFLKPGAVIANGTVYHKSRTVSICNEEPIYLDYSISGFGFTGRSVYQRALYPLKTYVQTMITDDLVVRKSGVLIAKLKIAGSIVDNIVATIIGRKRQMLREAETGNVLSITNEESIETLNMQNLDGAYSLARKNCIENTAIAADMPAKILNQETFAEGFGEGTEDAKVVVRYLDGMRDDMAPLYEYFDRIVQYRAWSPEFYETIQAKYPAEYGGVPYQTAFYRWVNSFAAEWPSLIEEPESEEIKVEQTKFETILSAVNALMPQMDPENKATLIQWMQDNLNANARLFPSPLLLDMDALAMHAEEQAAQQAAQQAAAPDEPGGPRLVSIGGR